MNSKGFFFIDSIFSFSLIILLIFSLLPILTIIHKERIVLSDRMIIASHLHDEIQELIANEQPPLPLQYNSVIAQTEISILIKTYQGPIIEACARWINKADREDEICFYGSSQK